MNIDPGMLKKNLFVVHLQYRAKAGACPPTKVEKDFIWWIEISSQLLISLLEKYTAILNILNDRVFACKSSTEKKML